jgi:hypothetical protein
MRGSHNFCQALNKTHIHTQLDLLEEVDARYKAALTEEEERELTLACEAGALKLDVLLPLLRDYIMRTLVRVGSRWKGTWWAGRLGPFCRLADMCAVLPTNCLSPEREPEPRPSDQGGPGVA